MIKLGSVRITTNFEMIQIRKKVHIIASKLGCTNIIAARIEALFSDLIRELLMMNDAIELRVFLNDMIHEKGIIFETGPCNQSIIIKSYNSKLLFLNWIQLGKGLKQLTITIPFRTINPEINSILIQSIKDEINAKSKEELQEEIKKKNEELSSSREFMESVLDNLKAAVYVKNLSGEYTFLNRQWEEYLNFDRKNCLGKTVAQLVGNTIAQDQHRQDMAVIKNRNIEVIEEKLSYRGTELTLLTTKVPMYINEEMIGICSISTDISKRIQMEEELIEAKLLAEEAAESKSNFLANMSHEIRTPMNAILGMSYLLQKTKLDEKQGDYLEKIRGSGQHLLGIINDILDFSKIEAGMLDVEVVEFSLYDVLDNLANCVGEKCRSKGLELMFDIDSEIPNKLKGDPLRVGQILINYVNNAIKFTEHGEIILKIKMIERQKDGYFLKFEVTDTGIGLTEEQQNRLFSSFQQADTSTTRKYGGTGLGLAISKNLTELMGAG
ncbi:ATP-binding protein [Eubacteriaceae bacterium ES2]|nr:ATP-binding protein [Eubacteriaceae bacterium ES2]